MGKLLCEKEQTNEAVKTLERALEESRKLFDVQPTIDVPTVLLLLAMAFDRKEKSGSEKSLSYLREAKEIMSRIFGPNHAHSLTSQIYEFMGEVYHNLGDISNAFQSFQAALNMKSLILGDDVDETMANLCAIIAHISQESGKSWEAKKYYSQAVEIHRKIPLTITTCPSFVSSLCQLSRINDVLGEEDEAIKHLEEARKIANIFGYKHKVVLSVLFELAMKYLAIGTVAKHDECHEEAKKIANSLPDGSLSDGLEFWFKAWKKKENQSAESKDLNGGEPNIQIPTELLNLAMTVDRTEKSGSKMSLRYLQEAKERMDRIFGQNYAHVLTSRIYEFMGVVYDDLGDSSNALQCFQDALNMKSLILGDDVDVTIANLCANIAHISQEFGKSSEAKKYYSQAVEIYRKISLTKRTCPGFISSLCQLSRINDVIGEENETIKQLEEARKVAKIFGYKNKTVLIVLYELAMKYLAIGTVAKHDECHEEAKKIANSLSDDDSLFDVLQSWIKVGKGEENESEESIDLNEGEPEIQFPTELLNLAMTVHRTGKSGSKMSLRYLREAKERMDCILGLNHVHSLTQSIYECMGKVYHDLGDFSNALQCYEDAVYMKSVILGDTVDGGMAKLCSNVAFVSLKLGKLGQTKEYYTKAVEIYRKIFITESEIAAYVCSLYRLSLIYEDLGKQDKTIEHLEEARKVSKAFEYKHENVLVIIMELGIKYRAMGAVAKEKECFLEVKAIAESLHDADSLPDILQSRIREWTHEDKEED